MRKLVKIAVVALFCTMLCGCIEVPPLTDEEMDIVAEYAAELLLKYDKNYRSSLLTEEELLLEGSKEEQKMTPTPAPTEEPGLTPTVKPTDVPGSQTGATPTPTQSADVPGITPLPGDAEETTTQLTKVAAVEGIRLSCNSYETRSEVVKNEYFFLEAKTGKEYMILNFRLTNTTDQPLVFDASQQELECSLDINTGTIYKLSISMLSNDLLHMPIEVPAHGEVDAVLVFEINSTEKQPIETANFVMMNKNNDAVFIKLQ